MRFPFGDRQFPEILVQRHKDSFLVASDFDDLGVAWIFLPVSRPNCIVSGCEKLLQCSAPNAGIEDQFHEPVSSRNGSILSWLINRLA